MEINPQPAINSNPIHKEGSGTVTILKKLTPIPLLSISVLKVIFEIFPTGLFVTNKNNTIQLKTELIVEEAFLFENFHQPNLYQQSLAL